jgi:hypothetical protein
VNKIIHHLSALLAASALLLGSLALPSGARAASGEVLLNLGGTSNTYADRTGVKQLVGAAEYSDKGRGFNERQLLSLRTRTPVPGFRSPFPYGVFGLHEDDFNGDGDYNDAGEADPVAMMTAIKSDGVYNLAVSATLGQISNKDKIIRTLQGARDRNLKLVVRLVEGDASTTSGNISRWKAIFAEHPELKDVVYALYSWDEPMNRGITLAQMQDVYRQYKQAWPELPVLAVFTQDPRQPDDNHDGISDGMLGQPQNPYTAQVADIVGLDVYIATAPDDYNYDQVSKLYAHARRVVSQVNPNTPIWGVAQAHGIYLSPDNYPEPHQMYRQANDWFQAGPRAGLPGIDGFFWFRWHFANNTAQAKSDLEDNPVNRQMAQLIGRRINSGTMVIHKLPYRPELYLNSTPLSTLRAPRADHLNLARGTITFALSRRWKGDDGLRHVLFDTGVSATRNRLIIEKTAANVLRFAIIDANGAEKWTGLNVNSYNMSGKWLPGYSEIAATWDDGTLTLYLDGFRAGLRGGSGTGRLSSGGTYLYIGTDLAGNYSAYGTYRHLTIRSAAGTALEIASWTKYSYLDGPPLAVTLASPAASASTSDRTPTLAWYPRGTAVRYQVQVASTADFASPARDATVTVTSYTTPTELPAGTYYWRVRAMDNYGAGPWSAARMLKVQ